MEHGAAVIVTVHFLLFLDDQSGDQVVPARISRTDVVLPDYFERLRSSHAVRTKVGARLTLTLTLLLQTQPAGFPLQRSGWCAQTKSLDRPHSKGVARWHGG